MRMDMEENRGGGPELPQKLANAITLGMRQGLIVVNDPREAEEVVRVFTAMIVGKDPYRIGDWRREYVTVSDEEFREELKLLTMPLLVEQPIARAINEETGREFVVVMRKIYILLLAPPIGFVVFGQPSTALVVSDNNKVYFGFKGIDPNTGERITVTIRSGIISHITIPLMPAIARFVFIGDVVGAIMDEDGSVKRFRE
jgi:hypothetical protein